MNEQWQYRVIGTTQKINSEGLVSKLNEVGESGRELCSIIPLADSMLLVFKSPKRKIVTRN